MQKSIVQKRLKLFPEKLYETILIPKYAHIIDWDETGYILIIKSLKRFIKIMRITNVCKTHKFNTIKKQFQLYQFSIDSKRITHNSLCRNSSFAEIRELKHRNSQNQMNNIYKKEHIIDHGHIQFGKSINYCNEIINYEYNKLDVLTIYDTELFDEYFKNQKYDKLLNLEISNEEFADIMQNYI